MTLADLASLGSFISGIAVFVSLALLYSQLRQVSKQIAQAEKNQRALMIQGANKRSIDENIWLREPQMSAVLIKAIDCAEELTSQDLLQLSLIVRNMLLSYQDTYIQHKAGLADELTLGHIVGGLCFFFDPRRARLVHHDRRHIRALADRFNRSYYRAGPTAYIALRTGGVSCSACCVVAWPSGIDEHVCHPWRFAQRKAT